MKQLQNINKNFYIYFFGALCILSFRLAGLYVRDTFANFGNDKDIIEQDNAGNLIDYKPRRRWRLNINGYSQQYYDLQGITIEERTKELLAIYGLYNWEDWNFVGRLHGIKTHVLVCITYADTSIGRFMKSNNNIGNVGNNDRGDTVNYDSILQGINAIGEVLNNRYLGAYEEMRQLAGSSNPAGPNYATEYDKVTQTYSKSRISNTLNCIGMIEDGGVEGSFKFRRN